MKILHIAEVYLPSYGGGTIRLRNFLEPMARDKRCEVHILVIKHQPGLKDYEKINNIHIHRVDSFWRLPTAIRKIIKTYKIDIIHTHNARPGFFAVLAFKRPFIIEMHAIYEMAIYKLVMTRVLYLLADKIVVLAQSSKNFLIKRYNFIKDKIVVIPNGINLERFDVLKDNEIRSRYNIREKYIVGYTGTFFPWQGVEYLVKAIPYVLNEIKDVKFLLVGYGPEFEFIKELLYKMELEAKVILTGKVSPEEIPNYIASMDIFVIPRPSTLATETALPLKLLEAMAAGKSIIATEMGGLSEVIVHNENGILIPSPEPEELAKKISYLLLHPEVRERLGISARDSVCKKYNWEKSVQKMYHLYKTIYEDKFKTSY